MCARDKKSIMKKIRCPWANPKNPLYVQYHDHEWGHAVFKDQKLFEMLCLEGAQAGLSWETILNKREEYQKVFLKFDPFVLAKKSDAFYEKALKHTLIVKNRLKVFSVKSNAQTVLKHFKFNGDFSSFLWGFVDHKKIKNKYSVMSEIPTKTLQSDNMSKALKTMGFKFVGSTICYAFMQAVGMVNDHLVACHKHKTCNRN